VAVVGRAVVPVDSLAADLAGPRLEVLMAIRIVMGQAARLHKMARVVPVDRVALVALAASGPQRHHSHRSKSDWFVPGSIRGRSN